jgi:Ca2+-binding RTX toxin-like protein
MVEQAMDVRGHKKCLPGGADNDTLMGDDGADDLIGRVGRDPPAA